MEDNVFAVTSGKGGVGKTTTVVNLGVALGDEEQPVAVVDADLGMPDVGTFLGLDPEQTLHDVLAGRATVDSALTTITPGVNALLGDPDLEQFPDADPDELAGVLDQLGEAYRYVLVDTGGGLNYDAVAPLEFADRVVLVTSPLPAAIDNTQKSRQLSERIGVPIAGVVVTQSSERADPESIAAQLDTRLLGVVPTDPVVQEGTEQRRSLFEHAPESGPADSYRQVAAALVDDVAARTEAPVGAGGTEAPGIHASQSESTETQESDSGDAAEAPEATPETETPTAPGDEGTDGGSDDERGDAGVSEEPVETEAGPTEPDSGGQATTAESERPEAVADTDEDVTAEPETAAKTEPETVAETEAQTDPADSDVDEADAPDLSESGDDSADRSAGVFARLVGMFR